LRNPPGAVVLIILAHLGGVVHLLPAPPTAMALAPFDAASAGTS
jgi:hypothetical protein